MTYIRTPQAAIWHSLNHYAYGDATFLAERLYTELPTDEALHLLATCYFRSDCVAQAYDLLSKHGAKTPKNRFLLAKVYKLNTVKAIKKCKISSHGSLSSAASGSRRTPRPRLSSRLP